MKFGPVPLEIYEMAKGESLWLAELRLSSFPWRLQGYNLNLTSNESPDTSHLSESDFTALRVAFRRSTSMTFDSRTALTHGPDWQKASLGMMRYEDMLDETADKADRVLELRQLAPLMRL